MRSASAGSGCAGRSADSAKPADTVAGVIEWDPQGLAELLSAGNRPALVWLSVGISLRLVAPVELDLGRVLALDVGDRWVLAPSTSGRAMLVPGRGLRIRLAQAARRLRGKRAEV